ncbi:MAG TPA: hypothetical protein VMD92_08900 [Acidobacteriaceae bacterium]|nr:hypothetical protein [Acidobacteriaceae bacterium]
MASSALRAAEQGSLACNQAKAKFEADHSTLKAAQAKVVLTLEATLEAQ